MQILKRVVSKYFPTVTGLLAINRGNGRPLALTARENGYGTVLKLLGLENQNLYV